MVRRSHVIAAFAVCAVAFGAPSAFAHTTMYDFSAAAAAGATTPYSIQGATFSSPSDPGAFTFGPNGGLFSDLGSSVLSSGGVDAMLGISFSAPQTVLAFDFALGDFFASGGSDTLMVETNTGVTRSFVAGLVGGDFFPEGAADLANVGQFSSVTISSAYPIIVADVTSTPEPASVALFGVGMVGLLAARRRGRG